MSDIKHNSSSSHRTLGTLICSHLYYIWSQSCLEHRFPMVVPRYIYELWSFSLSCLVSTPPACSLAAASTTKSTTRRPLLCGKLFLAAGAVSYSICKVTQSLVRNKTALLAVYMLLAKCLLTPKLLWSLASSSSSSSRSAWEKGENIGNASVNFACLDIFGDLRVVE